MAKRLLVCFFSLLTMVNLISAQEKLSPEVADRLSINEINSRIKESIDKDNFSLSDSLLLKKRSELMKILANVSPDEFLRNVLPCELLDKIPASLSNLVEKETSLTGTLYKVFFDDFNNKRFSSDYLLNSDGRQFNCKFTNRENNYPSAARIETFGYILGNYFVCDQSAVKVLSKAKTDVLVPDTLKVLVLLMQFKNADPMKMTKDEVVNRYFKVDSPIKNYFKEVSYGKVIFDSDVYGWYTLNVDGIEGNCPSPEAYIEEVVNFYNIDISKYGYVSCQTNSTCAKRGEAGYSAVGKIPVQINSREYLLGLNNIWIFKSWSGEEIEERVFIHEFGHSLGLGHANGYQCTDQVSFNGICNGKTYWNSFDVMGMGFPVSSHFSSFFEEKLGWLDNNSIAEISKSGVYKLNPLESYTGIRGAKIKCPNGDYYPFYIEYRRGLGVDKLLSQFSKCINGLIINYSQFGYEVDNDGKHGTDEDNTYLIDTDPFTNVNNFENYSLIGDEVLQDYKRGVVIGPIISNNDNEITFKVDFLPANTLQPPGEFKAYPLSSNKVLLKWLNNSANCDSFVIERKEGSEYRYTKIISLPKTYDEFVDNTEKDPGVYIYRIKAAGQNLPSFYSSPIQPSTGNLLEFPKLAAPLNNSQDLTSIRLVWNKISNIKGYQLQISVDSVFHNFILYDSTVSDTSFDFSSSSYFTKNSTYYWRVRAKNDMISFWSDAWRFSTIRLRPVLLNPPDKMLIGANVSSCNLSWESMNNIDSYILQISADSLFRTFVAADSNLHATDKDFSGIKQGEKYYWRVGWKKANISGLLSDARSILRYLPMPDSVTVVYSDNKIKVRWLDKSEDEEGFIISRDENYPTGQKYVIVDTVGANITEYRDNSFPCNTYLLYYVQAYTHDVNSIAQNGFPPITVTGVNDENKIPDKFALMQNYPNPFNPSTVIKYSIPRESRVKILLYDILGQSIREILNTIKSPGMYEIILDAEDLASGIYFYIMKAEGVDGKTNYQDLKKLVIVK